MALDPTNFDATKYTGKDDMTMLLLAIIAYCESQSLPAGAAKTNIQAQLSTIFNNIFHR